MASSADTQPLVPPFRFATVEPGLYRSAYPTQLNFRFLRRLRLCRIVAVTPEPPVVDLEHWALASGVALEHHYARPNHDGRPAVAAELVARVLSRLVEADEARPVLLHCSDGSVTTGLIVAALRRLQNWAPPPIDAEFRRFAREGRPLSRVEAQFLERLDSPVVLPPRLASWLFDGSGRVPEGVRHPTMRLVGVGPGPKEERRAEDKETEDEGDGRERRNSR